MNFVKFLLGILVLFLATSFGVKNMGPVELAYFVGDRTFQLPVFFLVLLSIVFGALIACAFFVVEHLRFRRRVKQQDRQLIDLQERLRESELRSSLHAAPTEEEPEEKGDGELDTTPNAYPSPVPVPLPATAESRESTEETSA